MYLRKISPYLTGNTLRLHYRHNRLMLFRETVAVYYVNHTENTNTLCGKKAEIFNVKARDMYICRCAWSG
jgi:hypothetical protein